MCRAKKGGLKDALPEDMLSVVLKAVIERAGISPSEVEDIIVGNVLQPGAGATTARMAAFHAG
jgi:acetyl-CoA acyltransferase 1